MDAFPGPRRIGSDFGFVRASGGKIFLFESEKDRGIGSGKDLTSVFC